MAGTVVISLDAELSWGFHDQPTMPADRVANARAAWPFLLSIFEEHDLPATWAVVGHLFLSECDGTHADHPAGEAWFARDPGGQATPDSEWFAPELIDEIRDSDVDHEIGLHTFSHVEFGNLETTREIAAAELRESVAAAEAAGVTPEAFVFPRNKIGHRELLAAHGFSCYRGRQPARWYEKIGVPGVGAVAKLATYAFGLSPPPIIEPIVDADGVVNIPASLFLFSFEGLPRRAVETVAGDPVVRQVEAGLAALEDEPDGVLHLWLHPNNITSERDRTRMSEVAALIADARDRHGVAVETMGTVADRVQSASDE